MKQTPPNVRFWYYHEGWVRIKLRPGQKLSHQRHAPNEEGYSGFYISFSHETDHIKRWWKDYGKDCDGYISRTGEDVCPLEKLAAKKHVEEFDREGTLKTPITLFVPEWEESSDTAVYDQTAQSMNY